MNKVNLQKVLDYIKNEMTSPTARDYDATGEDDYGLRNASMHSKPGIFCMSSWFAAMDCGTCTCIGGTSSHIMRQEGLEPLSHTILSYEFRNGSHIIPQWLGLSWNAAHALFYPNKERSELHTMYSGRDTIIDLLEGIIEGRYIYGPCVVDDIGETMMWHQDPELETS